MKCRVLYFIWQQISPAQNKEEVGSGAQKQERAGRKAKIVLLATKVGAKFKGGTMYALNFLSLPKSVEKLTKI